MVGKLSDDTLMSASRIPVLYLWTYGEGHPWSTPNDELRKSIAAKHGEFERVDTLGEPGICGNMLESAIIENVCEELNLPEPMLSPPVVDWREKHYQCSLDGLTTVPVPITVFASELVEIDGGDASVQISGPIPIECKVTSDVRRDEVPGYRGPIQLQMQMMAVNADFGVLVTLHRGIERHIKIYRKNKEMQDRILELCEDFYNRVQNESHYEPVNVDDCTKTYKGGDSDPIELHGISNDVERLVELRQNLKDIGDEIEKLQTSIMREMQDKEVAVSGTYTLKWPTRHYKAQPEKVTPAKEARDVRLKSLQIR